MKFRSIFACAALLAAAALLPGCAGLTSDLASPSGKTLEASLFSDATTITAAALGEGKDLPADVAALDSLGGTFEAYSTLPTTTAQLSSLAAAASSTSTAISGAAPKIAALVEAYVKKGMAASTAKQTVASAVYNAQNAVSAVQQVAAIGT